VFDDKIDTSSRDWLWGPDVVKIHTLDPSAGSYRRLPAWILVRPDGYIATSGEEAALDPAQRYLRRWLVDQSAAAKADVVGSKERRSD
jgi:hypothetical protein